MKPKYTALLVLNIVSLVLFLTASVLAWFTAGSLPDQQTAARWAGGERYAQLSVYTDDMSELGTDDIFMTRVNIEKKLAENSFSSERENARVWADAFSGTQLRTYAYSERASAEISLTVTGGDFFLFHPQDLICGYYYSDSDTMKDRVVIDDVLAWQLYGASDIVGKPVTIEGKYYYVAGVFRRSENSDMEKVCGSKPRMFMPYEGYSLLGKTAAFSCYEACLPDPVAGIGKQMFTDSLGIDEMNYRLVENSERFGLKNRFTMLLEHSTRSVVDIPVVYPYWENAARIAEDRSVILLVMQIIGLICPAFTVIYLFRKLVRNRKKLFRNALDAVRYGVKRSDYDTRNTSAHSDNEKTAAGV